MSRRKVYLDQGVQCPVGHTFAVQRRVTSMGKYIRTRCPRCQKSFRGYAGVVVDVKSLQTRVP